MISAQTFFKLCSFTLSLKGCIFVLVDLNSFLSTQTPDKGWFKTTRTLCQPDSESCCPLHIVNVTKKRRLNASKTLWRDSFALLPLLLPSDIRGSNHFSFHAFKNIISISQRNSIYCHPSCVCASLLWRAHNTNTGEDLYTPKVNFFSVLSCQKYWSDQWQSRLTRLFFSNPSAGRSPPAFSLMVSLRHSCLCICERTCRFLYQSAIVT